MANFSQQTAAKRKAPRTFTLLPEHFADTFGNKPKGAIELGLRVPSENEIFNAQVEANRAAGTDGDANAELVRGSKLLSFVVARGICSPHDVTEPHPFFELPEDQVALQLKSSTIKRIYDEIERLVVEQSPVFAEATRDECRDLIDLLEVDDPFADIEPVKAAAARRYLLFALEILQGT